MIDNTTNPTTETTGSTESAESAETTDAAATATTASTEPEIVDPEFGIIRTGREPAFPGGPPAPENPAQAPDPTTYPGGTAAVPVDLNAPSQQNVEGGVTEHAAPEPPAHAPGSVEPDGRPVVTSAEEQTATPNAVSTSGGPVDAPGTIPNARGSDANANVDLVTDHETAEHEETADDEHADHEDGER